MCFREPDWATELMIRPRHLSRERGQDVSVVILGNHGLKSTWGTTLLRITRVHGMTTAMRATAPIDGQMAFMIHTAV
jgi:hypothetical protein